MLCRPAGLVEVSCKEGRSSFGLIKTASSEMVDTADLNIYMRAHCASTVGDPTSTHCTSLCASTPHSDAGVESRIAAPPVSRGVYREQPPTSSLSSLQYAGQSFASPSMIATMGHCRRGLASREERVGRIASGPGGIKVGGEARARSVDLVTAPLGSRSSMGPSQGVGRVNQVQRLVDYSTYEGVCHGGCPPHNLATIGQGHSTESPA